MDPDLMTELRETLESTFPVEVQPGPALPLAPSAFEPARRQWNAPLLLETVLRATTDGVARHLAVTGEDLYIPMLTFVYGQAQLSGTAALISLARLRQEFYELPPNLTLLRARARKEAIHETGHLFGLIHCTSEGCAMRLSTNIRQLDLKPDSLCAACSAQAWERQL
jgi:archaemetzincin